MPFPGDRRPEALALCGREPELAALVHALREAGLGVEIVTSLIELRQAFFRAGGHDVLILGPDLPAPIAARAARSLRALDGGLMILAFGELPRNLLPADAVRLQAHHPASRAAARAVLRAVAARR